MIDLHKRCTALHRLADALEDQAEALAQSLAEEAEISVRAVLEWELPQAVHALRRYKPKGLFPADPSLEIGTRVGVGAVGILLPTATLLSTMARTIAAAVIAGNTEVRTCLDPRLVKTSAILRKIMRAVPPVKLCQDSPDAFVRSCLDDPYVRVLFCDGEADWISLYREAATQSHTKIIFEGQGNDPVIVFPDADISAAADAVIQAAVMNAGMDPAAPKRIYVHASVHESLVAALLEHGFLVSAGSATDVTTAVGPMIDPREANRVRVLIQAAIERGASLRVGGDFTTHEGNRSATLGLTILTGCTPAMPIVREPHQGPVLSVLSFADDDLCVRMVEGPLNGFCASVWGGTAEVQARFSRSFGHVFKDSTPFDPRHADARLYWGGYGRSSWVWDWAGPRFVQRTGPRLLTVEFSQLA